MVTDAAGTGFEIKKPHKGTETQKSLHFHCRHFLFEIKKPHKGTETLLNKCKHTPNLYLELGNSMRGQNPLFTYE